MPSTPVGVEPIPPRLARILQALGRGLMVAGGLVLAYAVFQLWGTGVAEARAQEELTARFAAAAERTTSQAETAAVATPHRRSHLPTRVALVDDSPRAVADILAAIQRRPQPVPRPEPGEPIGVITIPSIDVTKTIVEGTTRDELRAGPGHYRSTPLPGQSGNVAIAGHRTTHGAPFHDIDLLVPGDEITVETHDHTFTYVVQGHDDGTGNVVGHRIVDPAQVDVIADQGDDRLTLTACHPKYSARERIIVSATLRPDEPTAPTPRTEAPDRPVTASPIVLDGPTVASPPPIAHPAPSPGQDPVTESLGWQPSYAGPTALWAAITTLIAVAGWGVGRLWRRWPANAMAVPPFSLALFTCFVNLERLLPAV